MQFFLVNFLQIAETKNYIEKGTKNLNPQTSPQQWG